MRSLDGLEFGMDKNDNTNNIFTSATIISFYFKVLVEELVEKLGVCRVVGGGTLKNGEDPAPL